MDSGRWRLVIIPGRHGGRPYCFGLRVPRYVLKTRPIRNPNFKFRIPHSEFTSFYMSTGKSTACSPGIFSDGTKGFSGFDVAFDDLFLSSAAGSDSGSDPLASDSDLDFSLSSGAVLSFWAKTIDARFRVPKAGPSGRSMPAAGKLTCLPKASDAQKLNIDRANTAISFLPNILFCYPLLAPANSSLSARAPPYLGLLVGAAFQSR